MIYGEEGEIVPEEQGKIEYHYGFYAAIHAEYEPTRVKVTFLQEYGLGCEPLVMDMLIIKHKKEEFLHDAVGRFFKTYNVIEYKSPEDALSIDDFFKSLAYALAYKSLGKTTNDIPLGELTISIFRHTYPREMFAALEREGFGKEEEYPGIYRMTGPLCVPMQVVVNSRLPDGEYEAFKILAKDAKREDVIRFLEKADREPGYTKHLSAVLRVSIAANESLYQKLKEEGIMVAAVERLLHKELEEREKKGINKAVNAAASFLEAKGISPELISQLRTSMLQSVGA